MNEDASTFDLPEYIDSRLKPIIYVDFPEAEEEKEILRANLPFAEEELLNYLVAFLQAAHRHDEPYSVRDGVNIGRYALKRLRASSGNRTLKEALREAVVAVLGPEALNYFPGEERSQPSRLRPV
jgi:MoxR-like ATPase